MEEKEYRITEYLGIFTIEVKGFTTKGFFKNTKEYYWSGVDTFGREFYAGDYTGLTRRMSSFSSLDDAKIKLEQIKKGVIIHK